eukprot:jgi/Botrbrau1/6159/Bobra.331_2s0049.1
MAEAQASGPVLPVETKTVKALTALSLKRALAMFQENHGQKVPQDEDGQRAKIACKVRDEYAAAQKYVAPVPRAVAGTGTAAANGAVGRPAENGAALQEATPQDGELASRSTTARLIQSMPVPADIADKGKGALVLHQGTKALIPTASGEAKEHLYSAQLSKRLASQWPRPAWHPPWKIYRVVAGHLGWVRSIAVEPGNEWFCTGSADRTIKIWDLATGQLKLTLTGHIEQVTGLAISDRHPYMFSCGLDKQVKCWDLEYNKVIRQYHGHLSGVYCLSLHPTLDVLMSGGRDSVCRVWDIRTKVQVHCLSGHDDTVASVITQGTTPQVITGSYDKTIKLWDMRTTTPKTLATLTYHKKAVRALAHHPSEYTFCSAGADNIKKYQLPAGTFLHNTLQNQKAIINTAAINEDGVLATGADNGSLWFWDYKSGNNFQAGQTVVQPGSLESEAGIFASTFDVTGSRLLTAEADKTVKFWREDETATPETHPVNFRPPKDLKRF